MGPQASAQPNHVFTTIAEGVMDLHSTRQQLLEGVQKGYWTLEAIDRPSPGFLACTKVDKRAFPDGYKGIQHRNLLRDLTMQPERVQVTDPKDLPPLAHGVTPAQAQDLPVTLETEQTANAPF